MIIGPGAVLGGYRIERALGSGGMGTVYLAAHPALPRRDALKVLWPHLAEDPEFRARFDREANLAATLDHPNIVAVHNKGEDQGYLWIALQYIPGTDAATAQERDSSAMSPDRVLRIITEIGHGLDHAHRAGMLHRDIKPANFLLAPQDHGPERVLLADFGIAKPADGATELTRTGAFMATVAYASPEQLSGGRLDTRSDIYSLGCSFYRLLTGQTPYPGTQPLTVMMGHINEPPPRITALRPDLPRALDDVMARALAKDPAERFATCLEFGAAAAAALSGSSARTDPTLRNSPQFPLPTSSPREARAFGDLLSHAGDPAPSSVASPLSSAPATPRSAPDALAARSFSEPFRHAEVADRPTTVVPNTSIPSSVGQRLPTPRDSQVEERKGKRLGVILGTVLLVVIVAVLGLALRSKGDSASPAALPDPCDRVADTSRWFLSPRGTPNDTADQRRCDWAPMQGANVSASISVVSKPIPSDPAAQRIRLANRGDAQEVRTRAGADNEYSTCSVSRSTSYGYIEVVMRDYRESLDIDQLCKRTADLASIV